MLTEMSGKWTTLHSYSIYDQSPFSNLKVTLAYCMQNLYPLAGHNTAVCKFTLIVVGFFFMKPLLFSVSEQSLKKHQDISIIRHLSWTSTTQNCDIDIYVTNLMKNLIQNEFSTDGKQIIH